MQIFGGYCLSDVTPIEQIIIITLIQKHEYIDLGKAVKRQLITLLPGLTIQSRGKTSPNIENDYNRHTIKSKGVFGTATAEW